MYVHTTYIYIYMFARTPRFFSLVFHRPRAILFLLLLDKKKKKNDFIVGQQRKNQLLPHYIIYVIILLLPRLVKIRIPIPNNNIINSKNCSGFIILFKSPRPVPRAATERPVARPTRLP